MALTFKEMYTQVGQFIQDTSSGRELRIKDAINRQYISLANQRDWNELKRLTTSGITQVASQAIVYLPKYVDLVKKIISTTTPDLLASVNPETLFDQRFIQIDEAGPSIQYSIIGQSPIKAPYNSSAEALSLVSSDSGDTTDINVTVWGLSGDNEITETVAINGTSTASTTNSFDDITRIGIDGTRDGIVTITGATSSTEYATLAPNDRYAAYQMMRVWPIQGTAQTFTILYKKRVYPLVADGDVTEFPCEEALVEFAIGDILRQQHKWSPAREHERKGKEIVRDYLSRYLMQTEQTIMSNPIGRPRTRDIVVIKNG